MAEGAPDDFELDELNCHPLMTTLLRCIGQLNARQLSGADTDGKGMPFWLRRAARTRDAHCNPSRLATIAWMRTCERVHATRALHAG